MNTILALDFNAKTIRAALAKAEEDSLKFLGAGESSEAANVIKHGIIVDLNSVIDTTEKAIASAEKFAKTSAKTAILSLSNELVKGNTTSADYTREHPDLPIDASEIEDILKAIQDKACSAAQKLIALETGNKSVELRTLSSAIVDIKIDGHSISEPVGLTGSKISLLIYNSFAPLLQIATLEKLCSKLDLELLSVIPEPYALSRTALKIDENFSGIILDLDSDKTDLAILKNGILYGTRTFAVGANNTKKTPETWINSLEIALEDINLSSLPSKIYLTTDNADIDTLQENLALSDWYKSLPFKGRPVIDNFPKKNPVLLGLLDISRDLI